MRPRFWQTLPTPALPRFLLGVFFTFAPIGLMTDIMRLGALPPLEVLSWCLLCGVSAVGFAYANIRDMRLFPVLIVLQAAIVWLLVSQTGSGVPLPHDTLRRRLFVDSLAAILLLSIGYSFFVAFIVNEGTKHLRFRTEVALAEEIHGVLVPALAVETKRYEAQGWSFPTTEVGGDLVDLVLADGVLTGYLADVSGHGVPAGMLMGMLKSAARMRLRGGGELASVFDDLNEVLLPLKKPNMFATCAAVRLGEGEAQYVLAGHLPILHYRRETKSITRLAKGHLPLGVLDEQRFEAGVAQVDPGDVLVLVSDGITEAENAAGEEFGLERVEALLARHAEESLLSLSEAIRGAARAHGPQRDDQTLLLIRALTLPPPLITIFTLH